MTFMIVKDRSRNAKIAVCKRIPANNAFRRMFVSNLLHGVELLFYAFV